MQIGSTELKNILILGGAGTLGSELVKRLYRGHRLTVLSRDEHKQQAMKKAYPGVKFVLGDIRDKGSIEREFIDKDIVFHVAALKHIDHLEDNPIESIKTNVLGSINVADAAVEQGVPYCVFSSTDKAVDPINVYGNCKALSERIFLQKNELQSNTHFSVYRWGNVIGSQGSAIPFFIDCILKNKPIPVTDQRMSRFWITISEAVDFMFETFHSSPKGEVLVPPKMKAATIPQIIAALKNLLSIDLGADNFQIIGLRKGEKLHECLFSIHSGKYVSSEICDRYSPDELMDLLRPLVERVTRSA